jgi:hypothetical protein
MTRIALVFSLSCLASCATQDVEITFAGNGRGVIRSSTGRTCTTSCKLPFGSFTAEPDAFSSFAGFSGSGCRANGECLPREGNAVTATFDAVDWPVTLTVTGKGAVDGARQRITTTTTFGVPVGASVTLSAAAERDWLFTEWTGPCSDPKQPSCELTPTGPTSLAIEFQEGVPFVLDVEGEGVIEATPLAATCSAHCEGAAGRSSRVTLLARANAGNVFVGWNHPCGARNPCELSLEEPLRAKATFRPAITIHSDGEGLGRFSSPTIACPSFPCTVPWERSPIGFEILTDTDVWFDGFKGCPRANGNSCTIDRYVSEIRFAARRPVVEVDELVTTASFVSAASGLGTSDAVVVWVENTGKLRDFTLQAGTHLVNLSPEASTRWHVPILGTPVLDTVDVASRPGGGALLLISGYTSAELTIGTVTLNSGERALIGFTATGTVEWRFVSDLLLFSSVAVDPQSGVVYVLGYLDGSDQSRPGRIGPSTISLTPTPDGLAPTQFIAAFSPSGQPLWAKPVVAGSSDAVVPRVVVSPTGPVVITTTDLAIPVAGCALSPPAGSMPRFMHVVRYSPTGACLPSGASGRTTVVAVAFAEFDVGGALADATDATLLVRSSSAVCPDDDAPAGLAGQLLARFGGAYPPLNRDCRAIAIGCGNASQFTSLGEASDGELAVAGQAQCVRGLSPISPPNRVFVSRWSTSAQAFSRAWQFPVNSIIQRSVTVSPTESVVWLRTSESFSLAKKNFPAPAFGERLYRVKIKH